MAKITATQTIHINGSECGFEDEIEMLVTFKVSKSIPASNDSPAEESAPEVIDLIFIRGGKSVLLPSWLTDCIQDRDGFDGWLMSEAESQIQQSAEDHADHMREMRRDAAHA